MSHFLISPPLKYTEMAGTQTFGVQDRKNNRIVKFRLTVLKKHILLQHQGHI
jgi:hypothetical protein